MIAESSHPHYFDHCADQYQQEEHTFTKLVDSNSLLLSPELGDRVSRYTLTFPKPVSSILVGLLSPESLDQIHRHGEAPFWDLPGCAGYDITNGKMRNHGNDGNLPDFKPLADSQVVIVEIDCRPQRGTFVMDFGDNVQRPVLVDLPANPRFGIMIQHNQDWVRVEQVEDLDDIVRGANTQLVSMKE
ncbi:hypothetical protein BLNAU_5494 [Blattamonas nauphoetae]|uniref:Uncharacterized protein n=1 Tax=Blattamonas nauphoetae TaxID=2049346 RepID=A0ABQ9Y6S6_9EUKA|nr:hypothetical protein BLNAU_5494 [Blattamonas nauphoetae]